MHHHDEIITQIKHSCTLHMFVCCVSSYTKGKWERLSLRNPHDVMLSCTGKLLQYCFKTLVALDSKVFITFVMALSLRITTLEGSAKKMGCSLALLPFSGFLHFRVFISDFSHFSVSSFQVLHFR